MKVTDCFWEKRNLGETVVEITIEKDDLLDKLLLSKHNTIDYLVIKVPVNMPDFNFFLGQEGFSLIELQIDMTATLSSFDFNHKLIKWISPHVDLNKVSDVNELEEVLSKIDSNMFNTDRISIDPHYGKEIGCKRYKNWIYDEFVGGTADVIKFFYRGKHVGFMMYKENDDGIRGLLGGIYSDFQGIGLGLLTPTALPLYIIRNSIPVKRVAADISSNNKPVWELYENFGYKANNLHYVFVKHNLQL